MSVYPVAIITGAANGIGKAAAFKFAANGYHLTLADVDAAGLADLVKALKKFDIEVLSLTGDLQEMDYVGAIVEETYKKWGRIDTLINNAAWRTIETMRTISLENWEKTIRICLTAPAFLARQAAVIMEKEETPGVIINIASVMSARAGGVSPAYIACKGGLESLTYELAVLYGPKGIRVATVNPGNIHTRLSADYTDKEGNDISKMLTDHMDDHTPLARAGSAEEAANVCFWLAGKEASFVTGASILVDGGFLHNFNAYSVKRKQFPGEF